MQQPGETETFLTNTKTERQEGRQPERKKNKTKCADGRTSGASNRQEDAPSLQCPVCTSAWRPINNDLAHTKMAAHAATRRRREGRGKKRRREKLIMSVCAVGIEP